MVLLARGDGSTAFPTDGRTTGSEDPPKRKRREIPYFVTRLRSGTTGFDIRWAWKQERANDQSFEHQATRRAESGTPAVKYADGQKENGGAAGTSQNSPARTREA